jgi:hypothetical protein
MFTFPDEPKVVCRAKGGKGERTSASFPEKPNTILLIASGLVGLARLTRKFKRKIKRERMSFLKEELDDRPAFFFL